MFFAYIFLYLHAKASEIYDRGKQKYRLNSMEEPTDEMLQELMEDVAKAARESSARAEAELKRRLSETAQIIASRRSQRKTVHNG